ncbi:MAG: pseudouridine synthase [Rudaea sp.]
MHRLLAQAGVASRRKAEEMIQAGRVKVNGKTIDQVGTRADPDRDAVLVDGIRVQLENRVYLALNKPKGYISDRDETGEHKTALDLVPHGERLFAAGRLDLDSEGLLLLTNDGDLTFRLTHPRYEHEKEYMVLVGGQPDEQALDRLKKGVAYQDEWLRADRVSAAGRKQRFGEAGRDESWLRIVLHEGKKRQIRHMCAAVGHPVLRLVRVRIGPVELGSLKSGASRALTAREVEMLKSESRRTRRTPAHPRPIFKINDKAAPGRVGRRPKPTYGRKP